MFDIDTRQIDQLTKDLGKFASRAVPFAEMQTLTDAAFHARTGAIDNIEKKMTLRNTWTKRSVQVEKATKTKHFSIVGSTLEYMKGQEFGTTLLSEGKHGLTMATSYSSGEGDTATPRKRLPRKANKLREIKLKNSRTPHTNKRKISFLRVRAAMESGDRFVFLDLGKTKGIFRVIGKGKAGRIRMVHDMSQQSALIKPRPWLRPAVDRTRLIMTQLYIMQLEKQVKRQRLFLEKRGLA